MHTFLRRCTFLVTLLAANAVAAPIDRHALVTRHNRTLADTLATEVAARLRLSGA